jgi:hypothetical protein
MFGLFEEDDDGMEIMGISLMMKEEARGGAIYPSRVGSGSEHDPPRVSSGVWFGLWEG